MTTLKSIGLVARREIVERARSRTYVVTTLLTVVMVVAIIIGPALLGRATSYRIALVEGTDHLESELERLAGQYGVSVELLPFAGRDGAEQALRGERVDIVLVAARELVWLSEADATLAALVTAGSATAQLAQRAEDLGLAEPEIATLAQPPTMAVRFLDPVDADLAGRRIAAMAGMVLLFMAINLFGSMVLTGVVEEKSSRVVEVLLARIPARVLLAGKVLGIGVLGLSQVVLLTVVGLAALRFSPSGGVALPQVSWDTAVWLTLWFVLGFAFYSCAYAALGALATRMEDAQSSVGPLTFVFVAAYFFAFFVIQDDPESWLSVVGSFVPVTAPLVVPMRVAVRVMPVWQALLSAAVMAVSTWAVVRVAGRVYERGVLRSGKRMSLRDAFRTA